MVKTKPLYILATAFLSGAGAILSFISLGTQQWVTSEAKSLPDQSISGNEVNFGLFGGAFKQSIPYPATTDLTMTCLLGANVCALLCGSAEARNDDLQALYDGENVEIGETCAQIFNRDYDTKMYNRWTLRESDGERIFINAGSCISTITFLCISALMGVISAGLAVWNTAASPYRSYLSVFGLYIYNGVAFLSDLLAIILWGVMFSMDVKRNIPTYQTFNGEFTTENLARLGYSYWINLVSLFCYVVSIALLYVRNYLIAQEPEVNVHLEDNADPGIYLY